MPTVPSYGNFQVSPNTFSGERLNAPAIADSAGQQAQQLGDAMQRSSQAIGNIANDEQSIDNQIRLRDAMSQLRSAGNTLTWGDPGSQTRGYLQFKSKDALQPDANGQSLATSYTNKLGEQRDSIAASLGNDLQRREFMLQAQDYMTGFSGQIEQHVRGQADVFTRETNEGAVKLAADTAGLNWSNPEMVAKQVDAAKAAAYDQSRYEGMPGDAQTMMIKSAASSIYRRVIETALEQNNPSYALAFKDQYKDGMTADDTLAVLGKINHQIDAQTALGVVQNTVRQFSAQIAPSDLDRLRAVRDGLESGGKDYNVDGTPITSPKGAKYKNQVTPSTAANPGFGIQPAQADTPAEYNRVGDQLLAAMVTKYGDVGKALAAYNAGSGAVDQAIKDNPQNWLAALPKETQAYVTKGVSQYNTGAGQPQMPTKDQFVQAALAQLPTTSRPELVAMARTQAEQQYSLLESSRKEQADQTWAAVQRALIGNGGNRAALPAELTTALARYAPDKFDNMNEFADRIANPLTKSNTDAYAMAVTYPDELAKMSDTQFSDFMRANFTVRDQERVAKIRSDVLNGTTKDTAGSMNHAAFADSVDNRLTAIGVDPHPKAGDTDGRQQVASVQKFLADGIYSQQQTLGRKMTPQEINQYVDQQFLKNAQFRSTLFGVAYGTPTPTPYLSMKVADLPDDTVTQIKGALLRQGNANPTNDQILRTYWAARMKNNG